MQLSDLRAMQRYRGYETNKQLKSCTAKANLKHLKCNNPQAGQKLLCGVGGPKLRVHPPLCRMMLPPGSIWFTGQLIGLGYCKMLGEAVCPSIKGLPGTKFASAKQ